MSKNTHMDTRTQGLPAEYSPVLTSSISGSDVVALLDIEVSGHPS